ncbi:MAG TPA: Ig domain-containing protein [Candidatus Acidoferrales bacterium]|nr:Ig domain-containing protein [Candidatus Acidoferrales bacterium]
MAFVVTTASLPGAVIGTAYSATLASTGGTAPITWALKTGTLPVGLSLDADTGVLSGTPTTVEAATPLTFEATDTDMATADSSGLTLVVNGSVAPTGNAKPRANVSPTFPLMPQAWPLTRIAGSDPLAAETLPQTFDPNDTTQADIVADALEQSGNTGNRLT